MKLVVLAAAACLVFTLIGPVIGNLRGATTGPINVTATLAISSKESLPPAGLRADTVHQSWRLNDREGIQIGRMLLSCRWVLHGARFCSGELQMPKGTIQVQGASPTRFTGLYAVVGGTGLYSSGGGTMKFTAIGARKSVLLVTITT